MVSETASASPTSAQAANDNPESASNSPTLDERTLPGYTEYRSAARRKRLLIVIALGVASLLTFFGLLYASAAYNGWLVNRADGGIARASGVGMLVVAAGLAAWALTLYTQNWSLEEAWATNVHRARLGLADEAAEDVKDVQDWVGRSTANRRLMEAYDGTARDQAAQAHRKAMNAMVAGMVAIFIGLGSAVLIPDSAGKFAAAIVTATGAAAASYIARTFIRVRESTANQMAFYFQQPLVESYLLAAERLARQLPEQQKHDQFAAIIAAALSQAIRPSSAHVGGLANIPRNAPRGAAADDGSH